MYGCQNLVTASSSVSVFRTSIFIGFLIGLISVALPSAPTFMGLSVFILHHVSVIAGIKSSVKKNFFMIWIINKYKSDFGFIFNLYFILQINFMYKILKKKRHLV
ncbi:MAG: hypothetical protein WCG25_03985 [bacterium]